MTAGPASREHAAPSDRSPVPLRPGRDDDAVGFIRLIGEAWGEHPGCILDVDGENPELCALATHFAAADGALWVAEQAGEMLGMIGARPLSPGGNWEICRVYVRRDRRGGGLAHALLDAAESHAAAGGAARLLLWTDTRFLAAHAFYEKRGYLRHGAIRALDDLSRSLEFRYAKPVRSKWLRVGTMSITHSRRTASGWSSASRWATRAPRSCATMPNRG